MEENLTRPHHANMIGKKLLFLLIFFAGIFFVPWRYVNWGKIEYASSATITVRGEAKKQERSQVAQFSAGVTVVSDDKDTAVNEVNIEMEALIQSVKVFGIADEDIKTQRVNINQIQDMIPNDEGGQDYVKGQWRANNTIEIKLKDVDKASQLAELLTNSGATNVYGPNFMVDDTKEIEVNLMGEAIENARQRAEKAAQASGRKLGKVLTVVEGSSGYRGPTPMMAMELGNAGAPPLEPGSSVISQSVTVTFELE